MATSMMTFSGPSGVPVSMAPNSGPMHMASAPTNPGQCKVPGCTKPCFIEKGRVHEFCGKTHADLYKKSVMQQQQPHPAAPVMYKLPHTSQPPMLFHTSSGVVIEIIITCVIVHLLHRISGNIIITKSGNLNVIINNHVYKSFLKPKICEKCRAKAANPGYPLCQDCFMKTRQT